MFKLLAKLNKLILPSFTKQQLDLAKAKKMANGYYWLALLCNLSSYRLVRYGCENIVAP